MKNRLLLVLLCAVSTVILPSFRSARAADTRPNIIFILTDDQAPWALGLSGHPHAKTPHMDKLFKQGAYLKNSFTVTPVCSPSRASLVTSRFGSELGITDWIHGWKRNGWKTSQKKPVKNAALWQELDEARTRHDVNWHWVKGHAGHPENDRADELARMGVSEI